MLCTNILHNYQRDRHSVAIFLGSNLIYPRLVGPSSRKSPDGLTCTVLKRYLDESIRSAVYYRLKRRSIIFVGKFSRRKCSCVDDKTFVLLHTGLEAYHFPRELPEIRITTWYGRIISKKANIRIGYGRSVPCGMSVICRLLMHFYSVSLA